MKKLNYLARLRLASRWMLPPEEADEVAADYADLLEGDSRTDAALCQDFGRPWRAVEMLRQPRAYRSWLILFWLMAACLLIPLCSILFQWYGYWGILNLLQNQFLILGAAFLLALLGFQRFGAQKGRLPLSFFVLAVLLVLLCACVVVMTAVTFHPAFLQWLAQLQWGHSVQTGQLYGTALELIALFSTLSGLWSLVRARVSDRRWRALFLLSLAVVLAALHLLRILKNMSLDMDNYGWFNGYTRQTILLAVLGLAGTGVLLC